MKNLRGMNWRYRCLSITLCILALFSIMVMNSSRYNNVTYEDDQPIELTESTYERKQSKHMKNVVAYSIERQLQMVQNKVEVCSNYKLPDQSALNIHNRYWQQPISGVYFYSAHFDNRIEKHNFVRILGMIDQDWKSAPLYCQLWYDEKTLAVEGQIVDIWLSHWDPNALKNTSKPVIFSCEIPTNKIIPIGVSITDSSCSNVSTFIPIKSKLKMNRSDIKGQFALCVKGLDYTTDISLQLISWIELNIILGAEKFFIYVYTIHKKVRRILEYYASKGLVQIIDITLPPHQPNEPSKRTIFLKQELWQKRRNEIIPYNDCYYRNLNSYQFVIPIDIDEIILPVKHRTWGEMFEEIKTNDSKIFKRISSFSVRNTYFLEIYPEKNHRKNDSLYIFKHLTRSDFSPGEDSVKSFIATTHALVVFNHFTLRTLRSDVTRSLILDTGLVQMNHYRRDCDERLVEDCVNIRRVYKRDGLILKYEDELRERVRDMTSRRV